MDSEGFGTGHPTTMKCSDYGDEVHSLLSKNGETNGRI